MFSFLKVVYRGRGRYARNMLRDLKRPECRCVRSISAGCLSFAVRDAYFVIAGFRFRVMMRFPIDHHILGYGLRNSANSVLYHHHHPGHYRTKKMFYDYHHITVVKNRIEQEKLFLKVRPGSDFHCSCVLPCCVAFHQPCGVSFSRSLPRPRRTRGRRRRSERRRPPPLASPLLRRKRRRPRRAR